MYNSTLITDLLEEIPVDTFLSVKMERKEKNGKTLFVNYIIPRQRKDNSFRTYGDLFFYFSKLERFRFARGYILQESWDKSCWMAEKQYFYFDRKNIFLEPKEIKQQLFHPKAKATNK